MDAIWDAVFLARVRGVPFGVKCGILHKVPPPPVNVVLAWVPEDINAKETRREKNERDRATPQKAAAQRRARRQRAVLRVPRLGAPSVRMAVRRHGPHRLLRWALPSVERESRDIS